MSEPWSLTTSGDADPVIAAIALVHSRSTRCFSPMGTHKTRLTRCWPA